MFLILAFRAAALYKENLIGAWRLIYVITAVALLYLDVFDLVVQSFVKLALNVLAPTQSEPPFAITQAVALLIFILIALIAIVKFRPVTAVRVYLFTSRLMAHLDISLSCGIGRLGSEASSRCSVTFAETVLSFHSKRRPIISDAKANLAAVLSRY